MRTKLNQIIFGTETRAGRLFDVYLIIFIAVSVLAALLDSVPVINTNFHRELLILEWVLTGFFTIEYVLRLYSSDSMRSYAFSFFGLVDLFSILPTFVSLIVPAASYLLILRLFRLLRIFRVLKLVRYMGDANILVRALLQSRRKIFIFLFSVLITNVIFGSVMYVVEGPENGFTSIPASIYWAIVTITTVGYGDISPHTDLGRFIASLAMLTGYAIIAVPTGIVSSELMNEFQLKQKEVDHDYTLSCKSCGLRGHDRDARYCKQCGSAGIGQLEPREEKQEK